jgi:hypothetical protein
MLRTLTANPYTISTPDASLRNNLCLTGRDANGLGRAFPHAGVTDPASFLNRRNKGFLTWEIHEITSAPLSEEKETVLSSPFQAGPLPTDHGLDGLS